MTNSYHSDTSRISNSMLSLLKQSPTLFYRRYVLGQTTEPSDAMQFAKCRLTGFESHTDAADYTLCGFCKYPSDEEGIYYVVRHDGSTTFFKESDLVVREEQR